MSVKSIDGRPNYRDADECPRSGQNMHVVSAETGHMVQLETVNRVCRGCGTVLTVTTNVFGIAPMPRHTRKGTWLDEA